MADVDIRVCGGGGGGFADDQESVSTVVVPAAAAGGASSLSPGLRGLNPALSGNHRSGASSSAVVVGMPSQEGVVTVPGPFRGYFDFDEAELPRKSANMTERVAVPSSEHVAEIVGRQGKRSRGHANIVCIS